MHNIKSALLCCENRQEARDIVLLVHRLIAASTTITIVLLDDVHGENTAEEYAALSHPERIRVIRIRRRVKIRRIFKAEPLAVKLIVFACNLLLLRRSLRGRTFSLILTGVPSVWARYVRRLAGGPLIVLVRSLMLGMSTRATNAEVKNPVLERAMRSIGLAFLMAGRSIWDAADAVLVPSEIVRRYLLDEGVPAGRLHVIGQIEHVSPANASVPLSRANSQRVVFVSQGFRWHAQHDLHDEQEAAVRRLARHFGRRLTVLVHPRDHTNYSELTGGAVVVSSSDMVPASSWVADPPIAFVGCTSTLLFEIARLGIPTCFYASGRLLEYYRTWFRSLDVNPISSDEELFMVITRLARDPEHRRRAVSDGVARAVLALGPLGAMESGMRIIREIASPERQRQ